jgi:hypothetical protein
MAETHLLRARRRGGEHRAEAWVLAGVIVAATVSAGQVVRRLAERFKVQTQWPTLAVAGGLVCWAPRAFGVTVGLQRVAQARGAGCSVVGRRRSRPLPDDWRIGSRGQSSCLDCRAGRRGTPARWFLRHGAPLGVQPWLRCRHFSVAGHPRGLPRASGPGRLTVPHRRGRSPHVVASSTTCLGPVCSILGSPSSTRTPRAWGAWPGDATTRSSREVPRVRRPAD